MKLIVIIHILILVYNINGARILGVFHTPAFSHQQLGYKLLQELAARGHDVTMVTPIPPKTPTKNFRVIELTHPQGNQGPKKNLFEESNVGIIGRILRLDFMGLMFTEMTLNHTNVQNLLKSDEKFDIVIIEQFLNEAFKGFCYHFNAPCIVLSTVGSSRWTNSQMGNPTFPSYMPDMYLSLSSNMDFWERLYNSFVHLGTTLFSHLYTFRKQNELLQKYFPNTPHLNDLYYNTSLMLVNAHVSINAPVPYVPNMIEIGGFHVNKPGKLPEDLQKYLDASKDGVIFFSMGSNLQSKNMAPEKRDAVLKVFSRLKHKVLWKWEDETLPNRPPNVKLGKWLPQQDILAHPNTKLFITHGGLLSTIETIHYGVPIVGIPIFGDQEMNVANAIIGGYGIAVPYKHLTEKTFGKALEEILNNPKYTDNAKKRSEVLHDQPMKPLDKAVFWIEYVIRHQGAPHLTTAALSLAWYQYLLLDVVMFVILTVLLTLYVIYKIIKRFCCKKNTTRTTQTKKNNSKL